MSSSNANSSNGDTVGGDKQRTVVTVSMGLQRVCRELSANNPNLTELNLDPRDENNHDYDSDDYDTDGNITKIDRSEMEFLAKTMPSNRYLIKIDLDNNNIGDKGAIALTDVLPHTIIKTVCLCNNNIGPKGAAALAVACQHETCVVERLYLDRNDIKKDGATAFTNGFKSSRHQTLKYLSLMRNKINDEITIILFNGLADNDYSKLETLILEGNLITDVGAKKIAPLLKQLNQNIKEVNLYGNKFTTEGKKRIITEGLKYNYSLTAFNYGELYSSDLYYEKVFYLNLNMNGRRLLKHDQNEVKPYIWAMLLSKKSIKEEDPPSMMYYFLRENPDLCNHVRVARPQEARQQQILVQQEEDQQLLLPASKKRKKN